MSINLEKYKEYVRNAVYDSYSARINEKDTIPKEAEKAAGCQLFFFDNEYNEYTYIHEQLMHKVSYLLRNIILELAKERSMNVSTSLIASSGYITIDDLFINYKKAPLFSIVIIEKSVPKLFMFKEYGINKTMERQRVDSLFSQLGIKECYYVSLVETNAYSEVLNHNNDINDITRGTYIYSLKQFFEMYFDVESYQLVKDFSDYCVEFINKNLGLFVLKSLVPGSIYSFKNDVIEKLRSYPFQMEIGASLNEDDYLYLCKNYYEVGNNRATISDISLQDDGFGQSLITAEWLFQKRDYLGNIDLTVVSLGYYKAVEELLFRFILSCANGKRFISIKVGDNELELTITEENFDKYKSRIMLGEMIRFLRQCPKIFYSSTIKKVVLDEIDEVKKLRNGFLHKENLNDPRGVKESRKHVFNVLFLILGSLQRNELTNRIFGFEEHSDFELLCRFMHDHQHMSYYIEDDEHQFFAMIDSKNCQFDYTETGNILVEKIFLNEYVGFSVDTEILDMKHAKRAKESFKQHCYTKLNLPKRIMIGEFRSCSEGIYIGGPQKKIWENGCFKE